MNTIKEPNFEGEEMKIPEGMKAPETFVEDTKPPTTGPILLVLTIIMVVIFAGLGYWYYLVMQTPIQPKVPVQPNLETNQEETTQTSTNQDSMSTSDELDAIEADIESTSLADLDTEMLSIENELNVALDEQ